MTDNPAQPLTAHLAELRQRLLVCALIVLAATLICYYFAQPIYGILVQPLATAMGEHGSQRLIYTSLTEAFFTYVKVAIWSGVFVTFPILLWQIWAFIAPGLYHKERRAFLPFLIATPILFFLGGAFVFYVVMPLAWGFFLSFQTTAAETTLPIQLEAKVNEYLDLVLSFMFAFGLCFQLPVLLSLLARAGFISAQMLRKRRKYAIIVIFIVAAALTPPDVLSQTLLALPLLALYEISILLIRRFELSKSRDHDDLEKTGDIVP
jgi:sec-independent protein translocase protein TatC